MIKKLKTVGAITAAIIGVATVVTLMRPIYLTSLEWVLQGKYALASDVAENALEIRIAKTEDALAAQIKLVVLLYEASLATSKPEIKEKLAEAEIEQKRLADLLAKLKEQRDSGQGR